MSCSAKPNSSQNTKTLMQHCRNQNENDDGLITLHLNAVQRLSKPCNAFRSPKRSVRPKLRNAQAVMSQELKK